LQAENEELNNATGFFAIAKAKASQVMLQGQIMTAKTELEKAQTSLGLRILDGGAEESYRCASTEGILAQIAQERTGLADLQAGVDRAQEAIDNRMNDWKQQTGLSSIPSISFLEGEIERLTSEREALIDQALDRLVNSVRSGLLGSEFELFTPLNELGRLQLQIKKSEAIIEKMSKQMQMMGGGGGATQTDPWSETYGDIIKRKETAAGGDAGLAGSWGFDKRTDEEKAELAKTRFELLDKTSINMLMTIVRHNVGGKLKSQSTAVWPNIDQFYLEKCWSVHSDGIVAVIGTVEAQNGFGAMGALNFKTEFFVAEVNGEGDKQSAKWNTTNTSVTEVNKWIGRYY